MSSTHRAILNKYGRYDLTLLFVEKFMYMYRPVKMENLPEIQFQGVKYQKIGCGESAIHLYRGVVVTLVRIFCVCRSLLPKIER